MIEDVVEQKFDKVSDFDVDLVFDEDRTTDGDLMAESPDDTVGEGDGCLVEMAVGYPGNSDRVDVLRTSVWLPRSVWRAIFLEDEVIG